MVINISYLVSAFLMPLAGGIIDRKGYLIYVIYISGTLNIIGHIINLLLPNCGAQDGACVQALIPYILYGVNYTMNVIVAYGAIPYVIDDASKLGTAYGVFTCIANVGQTGIAYMAAYLQENTDKDFGYFWVEIFFILICILNLFTVMSLHYIDKK